MTNYNWTLSLRSLSEDGIISDILYDAFSYNGITRLSDLRGDKQSLPPYLKEQALYLENFLNITISCNFHKLSSEDFIKNLPHNLITSLNFTWHNLNKEDEDLLIKRFASQNDFLLSIFTEKEQVLTDFDGIKIGHYKLYTKIIFDIVNSLVIFCGCFPECLYFSRYFKNIMIKGLQ